jgi:hypothetical protein
MRERIKKLWIEALRSGEYEQTSGTLRDAGENNEYAYCCLGVLEKIRCDEQGVRRFPQLDVLTEKTMLWAGLDDRNPNLPDGRSLAELNDDGMSFKSIANRIEKHL